MSVQAAEQGVELIAFSECCISGYWHLHKLSQGQMLDLAETVPTGPSIERLRELVPKAQNYPSRRG